MNIKKIKLEGAHSFLHTKLSKSKYFTLQHIFGWNAKDQSQGFAQAQQVFHGASSQTSTAQSELTTIQML